MVGQGHLKDDAAGRSSRFSPFSVPSLRKVCHRMQSPYRLVVRTSRRGRDNPGLTPGGDIWMLRGCKLAIPKLLQGPERSWRQQTCQRSRFKQLLEACVQIETLAATWFGVLCILHCCIWLTAFLRQDQINTAKAELAFFHFQRQEEF